MSRVVYSTSFSSTPEAIMNALTEALKALVGDGWFSQNQSFSVRLCLEEALVNAVEHGNSNRPDLSVHLDIVEEDSRCVIRVRDEGEGFDPASLEMPDCETLGGRGVCLIKHFMEDVHFNCDEKCLEMRFTRNTFACEV